jgi:hypothetical protein
VLREIAAAGTTGASFDVSNDRRAAVTLVGRGLADRRRRDGEASVFVATPRGRRAANQATAP